MCYNVIDTLMVNLKTPLWKSGVILIPKLTCVGILSYNTHVDINPFRSTLKWQIRSVGERFLFFYGFIFKQKNKPTNKGELDVKN